MMAFEEAVAAIGRARRFPDLLDGVLAGVEPGHAYRMLVKIVHPDVAAAGRRARATQATAELSALWAAFRDGSVASGDIAEFSAAGADALLKMPRLPADNDLMRAEVRALTTLHRDGDPRHRAYAPRLVESFTHEDAAGVRRTAVVLERQAGFVPLTGLEHRLDPRDVAWMWRRLLTGLGWAHRAGVVHGAILPEHVLIHPGEHGVVLVDWCYSVAPGSSIPALVSRYRHAYPPEVPARQAATAATDIYMATGLMLRLMADPPAALRRFAAGCRFAAARMRPQDAWRLLGELDELLENLYGPRRFRPFALPA